MNDKLSQLAHKIAKDEFGFDFIDNIEPRRTMVWGDYDFLDLIGRILKIGAENKDLIEENKNK